MRLDPTDVATCVADDGPPGPSGAAPVSTPIVQTSLFAYPTFAALIEGLRNEHSHNVYTRGQNPTVEAAERKLALLERGEACKCFASGMAAINAVMMGTLKSGDHVLFVNQVYGPTLQLARHLERFGISHDVQLDVDVASVERSIKPNTRIIWIESPGTMMFRVVDLEAMAALARGRGILTCVDNSWATPLLQKPIELGIDFVVHAATKYLGGHSDLVGGALIGTSERMVEIFHRAFLLSGGILAPFDAWVLLRGLRTLPVRMAQHHVDALRVAEFLRGHRAVKNVFHPAFDKDTALVAKQMRGHSGLFSIELANPDFASLNRVIDSLEHFRIGVSWGGVESIVISPERGNNGKYLESQRIPRGVVRLSIGLEGADVLIHDLDQALSKA
ncbi:MAG TPA: aminotransferase class I/II-fold pyridoxal phosphate-dependent enzyme [Gemmatimonadaceae bacterium]|nr:aminotransferase class I/II-fold pyridoxal phosphate-dependent enzyme [Gemmatimonadaceae bacterium]